MTPGTKAGTLRKDGYILCSFQGKRYLAHRLVWFYHHGCWPIYFIDHIDGDRSNNRIENLRQATCAENLQNIKKSAANTSGVTGVSYIKRLNLWRAQIKHMYKVYTSTHDTLEEAIQARHEMKVKFHTFHPITRPPTDYSQMSVLNQPTLLCR